MDGNAWTGRTVGGFRVGRHVGEGYGGELFEGEQLDRKRPVLLKLVGPSVVAAPGFAARFARDAELVRSFFHANVVTVYAAGTDEAGTPFMAMRPIEARTLAEVLEEEGPLEHQRASALLADAAAGVEEAHRHGLVHRGLSPQSILVGRRDGREVAWVTDFAVADDTSEYGGLFASPAGTAPPPADYVSPEQVRGDPATEASDVYALGAVLFHALTGRPPFAHLDDAAKLEAHLEEPVPSASEVVRGLPTPFDVVLARALDKDPEKRFASPGEMAGAAPSKGRVLSAWRSMLAAGTMAGPATLRDEEEPAEPEEELVAAEPEEEPVAAGAVVQAPGDEVGEDPLEEDEATAEHDALGEDEDDDDPGEDAGDEPQAAHEDEEEDEDVEEAAAEDGEPPILERVPQEESAGGGGRRAVALVAAGVLLLGATAGVLAAAGVFDGDDDTSGQVAAPAAQEEAPAEEPAAEEEAPAQEEEPAAEEEPTEDEPAEEDASPDGSGAGGPATHAWPAGRSAYTAVVAVSTSDRAQVLERARRAASELGVRAGVLQSSDFANLVPGVWVAYAGVSSTPEAAQRTVARIQAAGIAAQPYVRFVQSR